MIQANGDYSTENVKDQETMREIVSHLAAQGKKVGLCLGAYDLMHPGHIKHLESAKGFCDVLVVGITSDTHVNNRKQYNGPVFPEKLRAFSVSRLRSVDYVLVNYDKTAVGLIHFLKPHVYIKGPDYKDKKTEGILKEKEAIEYVGGKLVFTDDEKLSSTEMIRYIKNL
jgi:rfaE bifunctional protein nucleotidyltransferase chain/domain